MPGPGSLLKYSLSSIFPSKRRSLERKGVLAEDMVFFWKELNEAAVFIDIIEVPALFNGRLYSLFADFVDWALCRLLISTRCVLLGTEGHPVTIPREVFSMVLVSL